MGEILDFSSIISSAKELLTPTSGDEKVKEEIEDYGNALKAQDVQFKKDYLSARKSMMKFTKNLVAFWLIIMLLFVFFDGVGHVPFTNLKYKSSENVTITLITTTTLNILGCLLIVIHNLFPAKHINNNKN